VNGEEDENPQQISVEAAKLNVRTEKKAVARKRFRPPGDGRFFDGHH
jgi:hypothetical protein